MSKKYSVNEGCMSLSTFYVEYGRHLVRLYRRHRHVYAPMSNTASHDNHEKITLICYMVIGLCLAALCDHSTTFGLTGIK